MERTSVKRNYVFLAIMLGAMVAGAAVGWFFPVVKDADGTVLEAGATIFKPLGTVFINLMFCIVVPMVFASISSAVANMKSRRRAGCGNSISLALNALALFPRRRTPR